MELRDIKLEINREKVELEKVSKTRAESEAAWHAREKRVKVREEVNDRLEEKFNSVAGDAEEYHQKVVEERKKEQEKVKKLSKILERFEEDMANTKDKLHADVRHLSQGISDSKSFLEDLKSRIVLAALEFEATRKENKNLCMDNELKKAESEHISAKLAERELLVSEREKKLENTKSELRVWTIRLHKRYGGYLNDTEEAVLEKFETP